MLVLRKFSEELSYWSAYLRARFGSPLERGEPLPRRRRPQRQEASFPRTQTAPAKPETIAGAWRQIGSEIFAADLRAHRPRKPSPADPVREEEEYWLWFIYEYRYTDERREEWCELRSKYWEFLRRKVPGPESPPLTGQPDYNDGHADTENFMLRTDNDGRYAIFKKTGWFAGRTLVSAPKENLMLFYEQFGDDELLLMAIEATCGPHWREQWADYNARWDGLAYWKRGARSRS